MPEKPVAITREKLIELFYSELTGFNGDPEYTQKLAERLGNWCWEQMMFNIKESKKHTELLIYRVVTMRELQKEYFKGKRSILDKSKVAEAQVDMATNKLLSQLGYSIDEIKSKVEQTKLF